MLRQLTALGLTTHEGKPLSAQSFHNLLKNPLYAGWVCIPEWGLRTKGAFDAIIDEETYQRVAALLSGKRPAAVPHTKNHADFPLRLFIRCRSCGEPLTGSWSKGRNRKYAYYRCRNRRCLGVSVTKKRLEDDFIALLDRLRPEPKYLELFHPIVRCVWNEKQADSDAALKALTGKMAALKDRKDLLVDALLYNKIDKQTYDQQVARLSQEVSRTEEELTDAELEQLDIEAILAYADEILSNPSQLWLDSPLDEKQRLQCVFFPGGLEYSDDGFGTAITGSIFNALPAHELEKPNLASPTGFEPVLPP